MTEFHSIDKNGSTENQVQNIERQNQDQLETVQDAESTSRGKWRQGFAAVAANTSAMAYGALIAWTATALPDLRKDSSFPEKLNSSQESWIGSLMMLGAAVACPIAGSCIEWHGRRKTMILLVIPFLLGWASVGFARNVWMLYAGRFVTGFCAGSYSIAAPVFITEIADVKIRGALTAMFDTMITVGILYQFLIGTYASWRLQALACAVIPVVCAVLMFFVPESPAFLIDKGRDDQATKAVMWLRGHDEANEVQGEIQELKKHLDEAKSAQGSWKDIFQKSALHPISIGFALMFFQQFSGVDAMNFYLVDIFTSAGSQMDENTATNIVGVIQVAATVAAALFVDRYGRKLLLILSGIFMVISFGALGAFFWIKHDNNDQVPDGLGWLPLTSVIVAVIAFSIGFGPIPWLITAEIMPTNVKGLAAGFVVTSRYLWGFGVTKVFKELMEGLGEAGGYWVFGGFSLAGAIYVIFFVPETKGKSLHEIQMKFRK